MRKLTLLISMLFLSLGMAWAQNYTPRVTGVKENTKRLVRSISVGGDSYSLPDGTRYSYTDDTDKKTFTVWAGETISLGMTQNGSWMHAFVYIDQDRNGFTAGIGTDGYTPTGDLVSYSFYNNGATSDASGYNSVGKSISGGYINTLSLPDIVAPTTPGTYRIRFKYDWCNIDPAGGEGTYFNGTFTGNGGEIIDATLIVDYHFEFVKSGRPTKWYNVALHPDQMNYISVNASGQATATTSLDGSMNSIWGFVGNPIDGFKLVNAAGKELVFGSPATVADENGTVFKVVKSTYGGSGFALQAPNSNQCLNPQGGLVKSWTLDRGCTVVLQEAELPVVAQVDGVEYATLAEAITAAPAGATITFVDNITENVTLSKNVTINGNGKQYIGTMTVNKGLTVTVENVNFVNGGIDKPKAQKSTTGTYTIKNCTFVDEGKFAYPLRFYGAATINVENCTVKNYLYSFLYINGAALNLNINDVTVEDCPNYAVYFASGVNNATIEGLTVKNSNNGIVVNNDADRTLTIKDCKMENVNTAIAESKGTFAITVNAQGENNFGTAVLSQYAKCVLAEDATLAAPADLNVTTDVEGKEVAYKDGVYSVAEKFYAAKVGDVKYETFAAAVAAAPAGGTVTLVADAVEDATVKFAKNLTFDGAGYTFTGAIEFNKANGSFTVKNVKFNGAGTRVYALKSIATVTNLTVEECTATGYTYGFLYANKAVANVTVKDVTVENVNYGVHSTYGTNVTLEDYKATNVKYPVYVQNYGTRNVVLNNCKFEGCEYPLSIWERNQTNKITFNFKGVNEMGKADFCTSAMANIVAGGQVATKVYETLNVDALATAKAGDLVKLYADTDVEYVLPREVNLEKNNFNAPNLSVERVPAGHVAYRADVTDKADREGIAILLKEVYAKNSLVVKVYNGETLMFTCTRRVIDDEGKVMFPVDGNTTANIVLWGKESGSWINEIPVAPTELNVPNRIEIWADDVLVQDYTHESGTVLGTNLEKYLALECVEKYDAKVGEKYYKTLAAAVEAAQDGATVELRKDATGAGVVIDKSITIDFNEKTYTFNEGVGSKGTETLGLQILKENTVTLKNGTLKSEGENIKMLINNYANLTVEKMNLVDATEHIQYVLSNNCGEVAINNSVITSDAVALDACKYASYDAPVVTVDANSVVTGDVEVSATLYMNGTLTGTIIINKATGTVYGAEDLNVITNVADHKVVRGENGAYTIVEMHYVAQVGEAKYETFAAAVAAATAGQTIKLVADAVEANTVVLTKNLKIDGAGHTFTGAIEFKMKNGSFTVKNVNFNGAGNRVYALKSQSSTTNLTVEGCTATGYTYGFLYANSAIANVTVTDVTVTDVNYGVHSARGTNVTLNNFVADGVEYGVMVQNYSGRNVVLNNCSFTGCENPLYVWKRDGYENKITFNFKGVNEMGKPDFCSRDYAFVNADAIVGTKVYTTLAAAVEAANADETVALLRDVQLDALLTIDKSITLDLGKYNITRDARTALYVEGDDVEVTINGEEEGTVSGKQALYVGGGLVNVYGGNFHGLTEAVYVQHSGKAVIHGGKFSSDNVNYVLNEYDSTRETSDITVKGGTFVGFNPADNAAEGDGTNFVAESYVVVDNEDGTFSVVFDPSYGKAAKVGDVYYETFDEAYEAANGATIELLSTVVLSPEADKTYENATVKAIFGNDDVAFRIQGGKTVTFNNMNVEADDYCFIVGKEDAAANLVINGGNYKGETSIASVTKGNLTVTDGTFQVEPYEGNYNYTFNCYDASYKNGEAAVVISGGKFYNFNPADNAAEGEGTSFVAPGYVTGADAEGWWTVAEPVAEIGETGYISINHAFAAAKEGDTVTMIADVELGFADAVLNNAGHKVLANVAGKNITFDMKGKKISVEHRSIKAAERIFAVICVEDGAGLTVTGEGSIDVTTGITDANTMPKVAYMFWKRGTTGYLVIENGNFRMDNSEDSMVYTNGDQIVTVKGGTFTLDAVGLRVNKEKFPWIFNADGRNERSIVVTGGTYNSKIDEQWYKKEVLIPEEFLILPNDNGTWTVMGAAAHIDNTYYETFEKAYEAAVDGDVIELTRTAVITQSMTLNKNVTVKAAFDDIAIRVQNDATVDFAGTSVESNDYCVILGSSDKATAGNVNISAGTFEGETTAVSVTKGNLNITGGEFQVEPYEGSYAYTINCYDASYKNKEATVAITGGKFYNFNPADNAAEGAGTNFIPEAKRDVIASGVDAEGWWTVAPAVAKVAGNVYISLVDAVAAADNDDVVTLLRDVTGAGVVIDKSITIDFDGKTYTANAGVGSKGTETLGLQILKNNTVTLKNGTLTSEGENIKMLINNYANLTVNNMQLVDATEHIQYVLSNNCGEVAINNSVITSDAVALDACKYASYDAPVVTVDANSVVTGNVEVSATLYMNGTLNGAIVINGTEGKVNAAEGLNVTTDVADYKVVYAEGAYTVIPKDYIAQVGNVKYEYIDEAVAAGNYVTILKDFTAAGLVIDKDLTIDFAGHTYTFNEAVGKYNGLLINKGKTVTLKNGTLNVAEEAAGKFYTIIQNYANLTIENMHLDGENLDMWALTDGDSYVLTSNSGKVDIKGNTNITANKDGDNAYAFNAYDKTAEGYSATKVTVETTGFINGKIEKTGSNPSIVIKSGRYIFNVTKWCADGVAAVEQTDGIWLVTSVVAKVQNNDGVYGFATLPAAVAAADEGATITLMADVTLDEVIKVEKKLTFELGYKTITANCRKAFEIYADATFRNGNINAVNRCIDTRTNVYLTLYNVTLNANDYTPEYGNPQPLTIGGYDNGTTVDMQKSRINAKDGYGIITFVKSTVNISNSSRISGYNALYAKEGSAGSVFNVTSSTLTGDCRDNDVEGNSFSAIAIQENNVTVIVNSSSTVNADGNNMYAVSIGNEENTSWTGNVVEIKGYINGNILDVENLKDNRVTVHARYGDRLLDEGYSYDKVDNSYIRAKQVVTKETLDLYDTMEEYVQDEVVLNVKTLTYKRTFKSTAINKWQALYVPFDVPVSELIARGYDVAYPNDFRETVVNGEIVEDEAILELVYIKTGTLKANYPYLIKPTTTAALSLELVLSDVTMGRNDKENMNVVECSSVTKKFEFFGNYKKGTRLDIVGSNDIPFYVMSSGELKQLNYGSPLGAFRFYMVATMKDGSPYYADMAAKSIAVRVVGEENEDGTTTIYDVPEEVETEDMIFDLHGRRVLETEKGGIYIKDGKKFIAQ